MSHRVRVHPFKSESWADHRPGCRAPATGQAGTAEQLSLSKLPALFLAAVDPDGQRRDGHGGWESEMPQPVTALPESAGPRLGRPPAGPAAASGGPRAGEAAARTGHAGNDAESRESSG
jgi:hypothetical protein